MADDVGPFEFGLALGEDARHVERDIAHAYDDRVLARHIGPERGELRMTVVPADEGGAADDVGEIRAFNFQRTIVRCPGSEDDRVIERHQLSDRDVVADRDVADEADIVGQGGRLVAARNRLDRLMIGGDAGADQAVGHGQLVEDIDLRVLAPLLQRRLGRVIAGGPRTDDRDLRHRCSPRSSSCKRPAPGASCARHYAFRNEFGLREKVSVDREGRCRERDCWDCFHE